MIETIAAILKKALPGSDPKVTVCENAEHGHYSTNIAMQSAKERGMNPRAVAEEITKLVAETAPEGFFASIEIAGPGFINFRLSDKAIEAEWIKALGEGYGLSKRGEGKKIVVDYSAPNIAKPMSVGHLRSTVIGAAIVNLYRAEGYEVIGDNHLGDWGTQFGMLISGYKRWVNKEEYQKDPIGHLVSLYIRFNKEAKEDDSMMDEARAETAKLQKGDENNTALWKEFVSVSLEEFQKIYDRLDVSFEYAHGESFYQPMLSAVVEEAIAKGITKEEDGAIKIDFEDEKLPPTVIRKKDGSHLYATTDLATIKYRKETWNPEKILYVIANEQALHMAQVFRASEMLGYSDGIELKHVKFGMMLGESGKKFSTRKGEFIKLEELLNRAVEEASKINPDSAEEVGIGSVKYFDLSHQRLSDIVFDWDSVLNLKGNSAPYLQYTYSRLSNIGRKNNSLVSHPDITELNEMEKKIASLFIQYPDAIHYAALNCEPNHLSDYLFKLADALNSFYENSPVSGEEKNKAEARLAIAEAGASILKNGLMILGIRTPERM